MRKIILIIHNVRSAHNVGSLLRTADGLGVNKVFITGYSPYPQKSKGESRLPHIAQRVNKKIEKTALGSSSFIDWQHNTDIKSLIDKLKNQNYQICALEQSKDSISLDEFRPSKKVAVIIGNELKGLDQSTISFAQKIIEIPMLGQKESFNVAQAAAMALFHIRFAP